MSSKEGDPPMEFQVGRILEQAREERGLSLHQVEQATKIRARYLKELERENVDVLPAVYVRGSLRTYADYLGLDSEALVRELKYRQVPRAEPQRPVYGEPSSSSVAGSTFPAEDLAGARSMPEEKRYIAPTSGAGANNRLYLGSAALLILVLAVVAFASTLATSSQSQISQVRKPLASQVPEGGGVGEVASLLRSQSDARSAGGEKDGSPPERESPDANAEVKESGRNDPTEENQDEPDGGQDSYAVGTVQPSTASATATTTATAIRTASATAGASQATVTPESTLEPTVPPPEPPRAETAAGGPGGGSPGRRIVVVVVRR
jgi:transcriptional regulator with XRE-family HTH domain